MKYLSIITLLLLAAYSNADNHNGKMVSLIHSGDTRDCYFFKLEGVAEADDILPNNPWFAVPFSKVSSDNIFALLLTAKTSGLPITVMTSGANVCDGHAEVSNVQW